MPLVAVVSDTHIRRGGTRRLPDTAYRIIERADVILHAGDIVIPELLDELRGFAPVHAVLGNNDVELVGVLPAVWMDDLGGVRVGMVHDSGPRGGRPGRMRRKFPTADLVVFGHSHIPWDEAGLDGQWLFNPGSPTERRSQPHYTMGTLELDGGEIVSHTIHQL